MSKFGLMFGEFNPPTIAHTSLALFMAKKLKLNKIILVKTRPPLMTLQGFQDHSPTISNLLWKAIDGYKSSLIESCYHSNQICMLTRLEQIRELKIIYEKGIKKHRKFTYICDVSHAIKLTQDPDWEAIKNEIDVHVMSVPPNGVHGNRSSLCLDKISFHNVPNFNNDDIAILNLLKVKNYDMPYLQEQLDPAVLALIKEKGYFI